MLERFNFLFPLWAVIFSVIAYYSPNIFIPLKPSIIYLLALVMLGMGMTLNPFDFIKLAHIKTVLFIGLLLQFTLMPLLAWLIGYSLSLSIPLLSGMVILGA